ncbi:hypothetical protein KCP69_26145 [Salmonella enterica subsp. enterica]|nr:hypothetical protein KCP69_26145 [Salmonella enterica subsp. enterica]
MLAALRAADVGNLRPEWRTYAREAADIILLEKAMMVLEEGVIEGRRTFSNMLKYIKIDGQQISWLVILAYAASENAARCNALYAAPLI